MQKLLNYFINSINDNTNLNTLIIFSILYYLNLKLALLYIFIRISYHDFKSYEIYLNDVLLTLVVLFRLYLWHYSLLNILLLFVLYFCSKHNLIGLADIWLIAILTIFFSFYEICYLLFIASTLALIFCLLKKTKIIAFGPFIYLSLLFFVFLK